MEGAFVVMVLCYFIFSQIYSVVFCSMESLTFISKHEFDNKTCPMEDIIFIETAPSKIVCTYKCFERSGCRGVSYSTADLMCTGCDNFYEASTNLVDKPGLVFFVSDVDCGALSNPENGNVTQTGTTYFETATYVCNNGHKQAGGNLTRTCQADGSWSGTELVCSIIDCGPLASPAGGTINYAASTYLQTATYSCSTGYQQTGGDISRTCQAGGEWDGTETVCQIYTCAALTYPTDGTVTSTGNSFGDTGTFSCNAGYDLIGSSLLTCGTGTWDDAAPTCTKKVCGTLNNPPDGSATQTGTTYLETATYVCNTGYEQTGGSLTRTCQADGTWSGTELVCTIIDCGPITSPVGGTVNFAASTYLQTASYSCSTGYQQTGGDISRTCQEGGEWDGTEIVCQIYTCAALTDPADGTVTSTGNSFGDTGTFSCNAGFDLIGSSLLTCGAGPWDDAAPTCTKKVCGTLNNPPDGTTTQTGTTYLETTTYVCNTGYEQTGGSLSRTCQADGKWSGTEIVCTIIDCGPLTSPVGGTVNYAASTYLQTATYSCSTGYQQTGGDISRTCQESGAWDGTEIICQTLNTECGEPSVPDTHVVLGTFDGNSQPGAQVSYTCTPCTFFPETEPAVTTCQADGTWSTPVCVYGPDVGMLANGQQIPAGAIGCGLTFGNTCPNDFVSGSALLMNGLTGSCYCDSACCANDDCCFDSTCDDDYDDYYYR